MKEKKIDEHELEVIRQMEELSRKPEEELGFLSALILLGLMMGLGIFWTLKDWAQEIRRRVKRYFSK